MSFHQRFGAQPRWLLLLELYVIIVLLGMVDYQTSWELSLFVFYAFPIFAAAWYADQKRALLLATVGAALWWAANSQDHPYASDFAYLWAAVSRWVYFLFVAIGGGALAARTEALQARLSALERAAQLEEDLVSASEREQRRIGQDLHDGHCQTLTAIGYAATSLHEDLEARAAAEAPLAAEIGRMVRNAIGDVRALARGIFPVQMNAGGLAVALDELVTGTARLRQIRVTFETPGDVTLSDPQAAMHLYRIAQEALNNATTHSGAERVTISLVEDAQTLRLTIRDDGTGFVPRHLHDRGMGLATMRYRAAQIGAQFDLQSDVHAGTTVTCTLRTGRNTRSLPHHASIH
jgi:signal transduction histidine kinase